MKLSITLPLDSIRSAALEELDNIAASVISQNNKLGIAYAVKAQQASTYLSNGTITKPLANEAIEKNLSLKSLCDLIIKRNRESELNNATYEFERQRVKLQIITGRSEQDINGFVNNFRAISWQSQSPSIEKPVRSITAVTEFIDDRIFFDNQSHANEIADRAGVSFIPNTDHCLSRTKNGKLLGGVVFKFYIGTTIELSMAGFDPHWVNRDLFWATFAFPFLRLNCTKVIAKIPSTNQRSLTFVSKLGFKEEARIKDGVPGGGDVIILTMRREECLWLLKIMPSRRLQDQLNERVVDTAP